MAPLAKYWGGGPPRPPRIDAPDHNFDKYEPIFKTFHRQIRKEIYTAVG